MCTTTHVLRVTKWLWVHLLTSFAVLGVCKCPLCAKKGNDIVENGNRIKSLGKGTLDTTTLVAIQLPLHELMTVCQVSLVSLQEVLR